jgi:serine/threonine protein kinase
MFSFAGSHADKVYEGTNQGIHERGPGDAQIQTCQCRRTNLAHVNDNKKEFFQQVIEFFGVAVGEEPLMIVMELATNGALKDYLQQHGRHFKSKYYMCLGAAAGMSHIHEKSVIHCDIAARNCLYSENKVKQQKWLHNEKTLKCGFPSLKTGQDRGLRIGARIEGHIEDQPGQESASADQVAGTGDHEGPHLHEEDGHLGIRHSLLGNLRGWQPAVSQHQEQHGCGQAREFFAFIRSAI